MSEDRWTAYIAHRIARVRERIQETERLMRPPTPEEVICLQKTLQRLKEQESTLTHTLAAGQPAGLFDPESSGDARSFPSLRHASETCPPPLGIPTA